MTAASGSIRVLFVDDDLDFAEVAAAFLSREDDRFAVDLSTSADDALEAIDETVDCVVSDYEMPGRSGIEFLADVRERYPALPFVLFTGRGSEEVASEAISAGVTDYLQKGGGTDQYTVLANRLLNAVERARVERKLEETNQLYETVIEQSQDGIWIVQDGRMAFVDDKLARMVGVPKTDLVGTNADTILAPGYDTPLRSDRDAGAETDASTVYDLELETADGARIPVELSVSTIQYGGRPASLALFRDVTGRKRRQRELERERNRLSAIFEAIPNPVTHVRRSGGSEPVVKNVNSAFTETFGYEQSEIEGHSIIDLTVPDDGMTEAREISELMRTREAVQREIDRLAADGRRTFLFNSNRFELPDGTAESISVYTDITDRKERERALQRQNDRLDEFARVVSHDLRNPLGVATGRLELATEECDSDHLDVVADALDRIDALLGDLLTLSRQGDLVSDLDTLVLGVVVETSWQTVMTAGATLAVETDRRMRADAGRLQQLLENLFRNAVEHGSGGPADSDDVTVTVGDLADGFYVADDGPGIPADERDRVFESGYSTSIGGTGFGLSIVAEIAEAHGWRVDVTESAAGGARFEIRGVEVVDR